MKKVVVIGAGPAGMMAAATAANRGLDVTLIEKNHRVGRKILITGKGRCNITNDCDIEELIENVPTNGKFLYSAFYTFTNTDVIDMFNKLGVETKTERGKRVFPLSDKAHDVANALEKMIKNQKVKLLLNTKVEKIVSKGSKIEKVILDNKKEILCDSVIIATGGLSYPLTGSTGDGYKFAKNLGHSIVDTKPSLIGIEVQESFVKDLEKLSLRNIEISVYNSKNKKIYDDFGELEFTRYGVDGPVIIRLSEIDKDTVVHQISREQRKSLVHLLKNITLTVKRYRPIDEAIITSGGIKVNEINSSTMESKLIEGLFFAGEVIDVDAYTGGFNLQIAFSTGYLAGYYC